MLTSHIQEVLEIIICLQGPCSSHKEPAGLGS